MTTDKDIDNKLEKLVLAYIAYLSRAAYDVDLSETYYALRELNDAKIKAGIRPSKVKFKQLKADNQKIVDEYKRLLEEKRGSYVVIRDESAGTETLEFKPWIAELKESEKLKMLAVLKQATDDEWDDHRLHSEFEKLLNFDENVRVPAASFVETRTVQHQIRMNTWKAGGLRQVQRIAAGSNPCKICQDLDLQIFYIDECPPLSHMRCQCIYVPYFDSYLDGSDEVTDEMEVDPL